MDEDLLTRNFFFVHIHGLVESARFPGENIDNVYCKCLFRHGPDWALVSESGQEKKKEKDKVYISQTAFKSQDERQLFAWNLPVEATFKSSNVFGWPQLVVSVFGVDNLGNDVVRGYGWSHVPTRPGQHSIRVRLFRPQASTLLSRIASWFVESRRPEFVDSRMAAGNEGRSLVAVDNGGEVYVLLNVLMKDFKKYGFVSR